VNKKKESRERSSAIIRIGIKSIHRLLLTFSFATVLVNILYKYIYIFTWIRVFSELGKI